MKWIVRFIATGAYLGYSPFMPGTIGTLWGIPVAYLLARGSAYTQAIIIIAATLVAIYAADREARENNVKDPSYIVCDEICGYALAFFLIPFTAFNVILVFLLFRIFDIFKPYPVSFFDKNIDGGIGIVLDDLAAGVYAGACAHTVIWLLK